MHCKLLMHNPPVVAEGLAVEGLQQEGQEKGGREGEGEAWGGRGVDGAVGALVRATHLAHVKGKDGGVEHHNLEPLWGEREEENTKENNLYPNNSRDVYFYIYSVSAYMG